VEGLRYQQCIVDPVQRLRPEAGRVGSGAAGVDQQDLGRDSEGERKTAHRFRLVVARRLCRAAHQDGLDFALAVELHRSPDPISQDGGGAAVACQTGAEDDGGRGGWCGVRRVDTLRVTQAKEQPWQRQCKGRQRTIGDQEGELPWGQPGHGDIVPDRA
jgi:hypothetical protein